MSSLLLRNVIRTFYIHTASTINSVIFSYLSWWYNFKNFTWGELWDQAIEGSNTWAWWPCGPKSQWAGTYSWLYPACRRKTRPHDFPGRVRCLPSRRLAFHKWGTILRMGKVLYQLAIFHHATRNAASPHALGVWLQSPDCRPSCLGACGLVQWNFMWLMG